MKKMIFESIETHNLKKIDIEIPLNKITALYGRSGAGKSSLAFSTIHQLCKDEFDAIENGFVNESEYVLSNYNGLIPSVAIEQRNTNNNPRSTIYSYLNISQALLALKNNFYDEIPEHRHLKTNKVTTECSACHGRGETFELDLVKVIEEHSPLHKGPFICWKRGELSDYYLQLLLAYCENKGIDTSLSFYSLPSHQQNLLLHNNSNEILHFKYRHKGKIKNKKATYIGVMKYIENIRTGKASSNYENAKTCNICHGSRINRTISKLNVLGLNFDDLLLMPISDLCIKLHQRIDGTPFYNILSSINDMGLGYLNLSRSIPSLSGGELQKLIFSKLLTSNITGILIVIDEISSQINKQDFPLIKKKLLDLAKRNTLLLVEHSQELIDIADTKYHIGKFPGALGGNICEHEVISPMENSNKKNSISGFYDFHSINSNNIVNQHVRIPIKAVTVITGPSGSGKTSLVKEISVKMKSIYISQKTPSYSGRSSVATITGLNEHIAQYFSSKTGVDYNYFLPHKKGACSLCEGKGLIKIERGYEKDIYITCNRCNGLLFDPEINELNVSINGVNIIETYNSELSNLSFLFESNQIKNILTTLNSLGLSHLKLNRKTQSLSGGEMRRIKLCESLTRTKQIDRILIIDEPTAGLDPETSSQVLNYIYEKASLFNSVIIIEHAEEALNFADYRIDIGPGSGKLGGKILMQKEIR